MCVKVKKPKCLPVQVSHAEADQCLQAHELQPLHMQACRVSACSRVISASVIILRLCVWLNDMAFATRSEVALNSRIRDMLARLQ